MTCLRIAALVVATILPVASFPARASAATNPLASVKNPLEEVGKKYAEAQALYDSGEFSKAAELWAQCLELLPESEEQKATRVNILVNATSALTEAYMVLDDPVSLERGLALVESYSASYAKQYGADAVLDPSVVEQRERLQKRYDASGAKAETPEEEATAKRPELAAYPDEDGGAEPEPALKPANKKWKPMLYAGVGVGVAGLGSTALIAAGAISAKRAAADASDEALSQDQRDEADAAGEKANTTMLVGGVLTGVLLGTGVVLAVIGMKRRSSSMSFTPALAPGYAGMGVSGRF